MLVVGRAFLLYGVHQRGHPLNANFEAVFGLDGADAAGSAGEDDVAGQEGHVSRNKADQLETVENQLAGVGVLPQLVVLKELDGKLVRIDLGLHIRAKRRESVEGLGSRPLTFGFLDGAVADVLRGSVAEDVSGGRLWGDVSHPSSNHNRQLRFVICLVIGESDFDFAAVWKQRRRRLEPKKRFFGKRRVGFPRVVGVVQPHRNDFGRRDRRQRLNAFGTQSLSLKRRGAKHVALKLEKLSVHYFGVEDFFAILESSNCCHVKQARINVKTERCKPYSPGATNNTNSSGRLRKSENNFPQISPPKEAAKFAESETF